MVSTLLLPMKILLYTDKCESYPTRSGTGLNRTLLVPLMYILCTYDVPLQKILNQTSSQYSVWIVDLDHSTVDHKDKIGIFNRRWYR